MYEMCGETGAMRPGYQATGVNGNTGDQKRYLETVQRRAEEREKNRSRDATPDRSFCRRRQVREEDPVIRPPFFRDADRILHSRAYARYIDKTQVFYRVENDHITHRVLHVQLVAKVARTIARALGLNEDLAEAIALGHDIGHVPFGHTGEDVLSTLCHAHGIGYFHHNIESVWLLDRIEECDLTLQVLDGICCHNGEAEDLSRLTPDPVLSWSRFEEKMAILGALERDTGLCHPGTIEGCVVRLADVIAYLGRDLQDAVEVGLIGSSLPRFPEQCREVFGITSAHDSNRRVLDTCIRDLLRECGESGRIALSPEVAEAVGAFRKYNYQYIYSDPRLSGNIPGLPALFSRLFSRVLADLEKEERDAPVYLDFLDQQWVSPAYRLEAPPAVIARDFIAGMTDRYFENQVCDSAIFPRVRRTFTGSGG